MTLHPRQKESRARARPALSFLNVPCGRFYSFSSLASARMIFFPCGRAQLERPKHGFAGLRVVDRDAKPGVRIGPFEFLDRALHGHFLLRIEHGEGMMRRG